MLDWNRYKLNLSKSNGTKITPACIRLDWTWTGLSNLRVIDSPSAIFDPVLEQHKFVEKSQ